MLQVARTMVQGQQHDVFRRRLKKQGLLNALPDLNDLDGGDLRFQVDFRQVYATLIQKWIGVDAGQLLGGEFEVMDFV